MFIKPTYCVLMLSSILLQDKTKSGIDYCRYVLIIPLQVQIYQSVVYAGRMQLKSDQHENITDNLYSIIEFSLILL